MGSLADLIFPIDQVLTLPANPSRYLDCNWSETQLPSAKQHNALPFADSKLRECPLISAKYLTNGPDVKTVLGLELDIKEHERDFLPGDTIGILPKNPEDEVEELLHLLGLSEDADRTCVISLLPKAKKTLPPYIEPVSTPRRILSSDLEIRSVPKKLFIRGLAEHTENPEERRRLEELCSREGSEEYTKHVIEKRTNISVLLRTFKSCRVPLSLLLEHLPRLLPRPYSIASSPLESKEKIFITLSVVELDGAKGVCSGWLERISSRFLDLSQRLSRLELDGQNNVVQVPLYFRKPTSFRIPHQITSPILMAGPGCGIAPFLGFLQHWQKEFKLSPPSFETWLFFGCRYKAKDFIFENELRTLVENKILSRLLCSFSRDEDSGYIQENLRANKDEVVGKLLDEDGSLFICGDVNKFVKDFDRTLIECFKEVKGMTDSEAEKALGNLVSSNKYVKDVWC